MKLNKLNLCSGKDYRPDYVNADIRRRNIRVDVVCDMHQLPFLDKSFSEAVIQDAIEHTTEPVSVLREIHRVLKKSGELWLRTPDWSRLQDKEHWRNIPWENLENQVFGGNKNPFDRHKSLFTKEILEERLKKAGFNNIKIKEFRANPVHWHLGAFAKK